MRMRLKVSVIALLAGLGGCANTQSAFPEFGGLRALSASPTTKAGRSMQDDMNLASASLAGGDQANAIRIYRQTAQKYPLAVEPRLELGEALLAANAPQEAARAFEGAARLKASNFRAVTGMARAQLAIRQPAEAMRYFDRALKIAPNDTLALNGRAVSLDQLGRNAEAQAIYLDLLDADPSNMRVRSNYGLSLALEGRQDEAADVLASLSAAPDADARVRQNLAFAYGLGGNDGQAAHLLRLDLDEDAVQNNLEFFQRLRGVSGPVNRVAAISRPSKAPVAPAFPLPETPPSEGKIDNADMSQHQDEVQADDWGETRVIESAPIEVVREDGYAGALVEGVGPVAAVPAVGSVGVAGSEPGTVSPMQDMRPALGPERIEHKQAAMRLPAVPAIQ